MKSIYFSFLLLIPKLQITEYVQYSVKWRERKGVCEREREREREGREVGLVNRFILNRPEVSEIE
jgi:hypothetical protein